MPFEPPTTLYLLHGMKRSGNHAISNWLRPKLDCAYFNNVIPLGGILRGRPFPEPKPFADWCGRQEQLSGREAANLLVTLEDHALTVSPFSEVGIAMRRLLVIRYPDQLFSSRIRKAFRVEMPAYPRTNDTVMRRAVAVWKQHARSYLGEDTGYPGRIAILFDAWVADAGYRAAICKALDIVFDDRGFGRVSDDGGGSSFDSVRFDGQGDRMNVSGRVSELDPHEVELLHEVLDDAELHELHRAVRDADAYQQLQ